MEIAIGVHEDTKLAQAVKELALEGFQGPGKPQYESATKFVWLREMNTSLWLDTGDAKAADSIWSMELEALTTNNTLVNQVVQTGEMDGFIAYASRRIKQERPDISDRDLIIEIAFLVNARLALSLVQKFGARVSVELHPDLASDIQQSIAFAKRYHDINPEYFYIKVPLTPDGFIIARKLSSEGIKVNYTLGFSARQNYLAARFSKPRFVNVFLGRLNALIEENGLGNPRNVGEKAALASDEIIKGLRLSNNDMPTQQIAASLRSGEQVAVLAGMDILTIPPKVAQEYLEIELHKEDLVARNWRDLELHLDQEQTSDVNAMNVLWEIDPRFVNFTEDAVKSAEKILSGEDMVNLARAHNVALFHDWSPEDKANIRDKGKIPDLSAWPGVPIDDLMSMAALQTFAKDQAELDAHIERLIHVTSQM